MVTSSTMKAEDGVYIGCWYSTEAAPPFKRKITKICSYCVGVYSWLEFDPLKKKLLSATLIQIQNLSIYTNFNIDKWKQILNYLNTSLQINK